MYFQSGDAQGTIRCLDVVILNDTLVENDEYFTFQLSIGYRVRTTGERTRINILEDDGIVDMLEFLVLFAGYFQ